MAHLRTKRNSKQKNISGLVFSVFLIFVSIVFLVSLSSFLKENSSGINVFAKNDLKEFLKGEKNTEIPTAHASSDEGGALITKNGDKIFVQVADTPESRTRGLSGQSPFKIYKENSQNITEGMLFVFDKPETSSFWMKDMNFDLDIIWLDEYFNIVHIENALVSSYNSRDPNSSQTFTNGDYLAKYVLEVKMGVAEKFDLQVGDYFEVDRVQL